MGSDSIFHYNRFYDAAMQIKEGNFSYFISIYGFQQSARIVNAIYGPLFAYFQGLLILLSGNWFRYQLLSRFLIGVIGGSSIYALLRQAKVKKFTSLTLGLFYMTTFAIQYWTMRQGFSSWGAAILPFCFIPAIRFTFYKKVEPIRLAVSVALIFQVHLLSAMLLIMMYVPFFLYGFIKSSDRWLLIRKGLWSVFLFAILTANVWAVLIYLRLQNKLLDPFINETIGVNGVDGNSSYWLFTPVSLVILLLAQLIYVAIRFRTMANWKRVLHLIYFFFIYLSTSFFPWQWLVDNGNSFAQLIQFPFRFFVPATILLLVITGLTVNRFVKWRQVTTWVLLCFAFVGLGQNILTTVQRANKAEQEQYVLQKSRHVYLNGTYDEIKESLTSSNMKTFLELIVKTTPDYVPIYGIRGTQNTYDLYYNRIVLNNDKVDKTVKGNQLILTWTASQGQEIELPIVKYRNTQLELNGQELTAADYDLSVIGTPTVTSKEGKNQLIVSFEVPLWLSGLVIMSLLAWIFLSLQQIYIRTRFA
ncbi:hypothetical protein JOC28_000193 [Streptococcus loxodontisalivarius]|uniref:Uncharacterized protein n=2 Tax=Streptococcus loxodontisalivarius TaxID=1349415 RepID=A0ABS2PQC2_9STRE|nr:hypothetical protein [Streptococcus loxodontisalivarius]